MKDLTLQEKTNSYSFQGWQAQKGKELTFYMVDGPYVLLPMDYASNLFGRRMINQGRNFHLVPPFQLKVELRDYQKELVNISIKNFMERGTTFPNVFCSFGKTVVAAFFAAMFSQSHKLRTLVTYPRTLIGNSWIGTFQERTTAKIYVVGETPGLPDPDVQVILCMDTRLTNLDPKIRAGIGHFVIDEADCYCTTGHVAGLLSVEPLFITVMTATYERDDGFEKVLDFMVGSERITRISTKPFFVFHVPTTFTAVPREGPRGIIFDDLVEKLDLIPERNQLILQLVLDNLDQKILILTKHVQHAQNLHGWLSHNLKSFGKTASLLAGNIKEYDDADVLVATLSKAGRGFDEESGCRNWGGRRINVGILACSTKKIEQPAGRFLRCDIPVIFDIVDDHKNLKKHWNDRKKWYQSRNGVLYTIEGRFTWSLHKDKLMSTYFKELDNSSPKREDDPKVTAGLSRAHTLSFLASLKVGAQ